MSSGRYAESYGQGNMTFKGFVQMYSLQTSSEEEETWKDLR